MALRGQNTEDLNTGWQTPLPECLPTALLPPGPVPPWDFSDLRTNTATKGLVPATTEGPPRIYSDCLVTIILLVLK